MIVLAVRYLTGYCASTDPATQEAEWPPHPARVYMAMVAAHFQTGADRKERLALEWLEHTDLPPMIRSSDATFRELVQVFVPVNDSAKERFTSGPQPRKFPKARPVSDIVYLFWQQDPPPEVRASLSGLCAKVTRIGHSASLVQMWVADNKSELPEPTLFPSDGLSDQRLRVPNPGLVAQLERDFNASDIKAHEDMQLGVANAQGPAKRELKKQLRERFPEAPTSRPPQAKRWQAYRQVSRINPGYQLDSSPFDPNFLVFTKASGRALGLESTIQLTTALRDAVLKAAPQPADQQPAWLTGHEFDRSPTLAPHLAYFPLLFVGDPHADGSVKGLAIAIPQNINPAELQRCLGPLLFDSESGVEKQVHLWRNRKPSDDRIWDWRLEREKSDWPLKALRRETWTAPSCEWQSVTPLVLHHYPKKSRPGDVERIVLEAFASAHLPIPSSIQVGSVSAVEGAGHSLSMPEFEAGGRELCRYQTHVNARFDRPLQGPVLVGRGRFLGYGLFRPKIEGSR